MVGRAQRHLQVAAAPVVERLARHDGQHQLDQCRGPARGVPAVDVRGDAGLAPARGQAQEHPLAGQLLQGGQGGDGLEGVAEVGVGHGRPEAQGGRGLGGAGEEQPHVPPPEGVGQAQPVRPRLLAGPGQARRVPRAGVGQVPDHADHEDLPSRRARMGRVVWIRTISWEDSEGDLRAAYDWQASRLGAPAEFTMLGSLYPPIVEERLRLYRAVEGCPSALTAEERLLAAFVTSLLNGTTHCASGLRHRLLDEGWTLAALEAVAADPANVRTSDPRLDAIAAHAARLTTQPHARHGPRSGRIASLRSRRPRAPRSQQRRCLLQLHQPCRQWSRIDVSTDTLTMPATRCRPTPGPDPHVTMPSGPQCWQDLTDQRIDRLAVTTGRPGPGRSDRSSTPSAA